MYAIFLSRDFFPEAFQLNFENTWFTFLTWLLSGVQNHGSVSFSKCSLGTPGSEVFPLIVLVSLVCFALSLEHRGVFQRLRDR